jgi:hypothetical protein
MCDEKTMSGSSDQTEFDQLYNRTIAEYKKFASAGGAWRDTEETLEKPRRLPGKMRWPKL